MKTEKTDLRKMSSEARCEIRKIGIKLIQQGKKQCEIAALFGIRIKTVNEWVKSFHFDGHKIFQEKKRGVKSQDKKILALSKELQIQKWITNKYPEQYKLPFALWDRKAVKELIYIKLGVNISIRAVGDYLKCWGFTPQKPKKQAYEQNSVKVQEWLEHEYPSIKKHAKKEKAEIHWGDETGCKNQCNHGRSYAPKGQTPVKKSTSKRFSVNMISTVTNQGKVQFMIYSENMNADKLIEFFQHLIKSSDRKIFLMSPSGGKSLAFRRRL
jgi:transposase